MNGLSLLYEEYTIWTYISYS